MSKEQLKIINLLEIINEHFVKGEIKEAEDLIEKFEEDLKSNGIDLNQLEDPNIKENLGHVSIFFANSFQNTKLLDFLIKKGLFSDPRSVVVIGDKIENFDDPEFIESLESMLFLSGKVRPDKVKAKNLKDHILKVAEDDSGRLVTVFVNAHGKANKDGVVRMDIFGESTSISDFIRSLEIQNPSNNLLMFDISSCEAGKDILPTDKTNKPLQKLRPLFEPGQRKTQAQSELEAVMPKNSCVVINAGKRSETIEYNDIAFKKAVLCSSVFLAQINKVIFNAHTIKFIYKSKDSNIHTLKYHFVKTELLQEWLKLGKPMLPLLKEYIKNQIDKIYNFCLKFEGLSDAERAQMAKDLEGVKNSIDTEIVESHIKYSVKANIRRLIDKGDPKKLAVYLEFLKKLREEEGFEIDDSQSDSTYFGFYSESLLYLCYMPKGFQTQQVEMFSLMIEHGSSPDQKLKIGNKYKTIIEIATGENNLSLVKLLLSKGANPNPKLSGSNKGKSLLHFACERKHGADMVKLLVEKKALINQEDSLGRTPLYFVVQNDDLSLLEWLILEGADPSLKPTISNCSQPLHVACEKHNFAIAKFLIQKNAKIDPQDSEGKTPLHIACQNGNLAIAKLLLNNKADINAKTKEGFSPLCLACICNYDKIVNLILEKASEQFGKETKKTDAEDLFESDIEHILSAEELMLTYSIRKSLEDFLYKKNKLKLGQNSEEENDWLAPSSHPYVKTLQNTQNTESDGRS